MIALGAIGHFIGIAAVTLPLAGLPFALLAFISIRRDSRRVPLHVVRPAL